MNLSYKVLAIATSILITGYFFELLFEDIEPLVHNFEILAEFFTIFISFSIFGIAWLAYNRSKDNHALFFGATFLVIGLLDLFHTLSYPFMPDFITPNPPDKSAIFWTSARLVSAPLFLASVFIFKDTLPRLINKSVLFVSAIFLSFIFTILALFYNDYLPIMEYPDETPSIARILALIISTVIVLYSSYLYTKRIQKTGEKNLTYIIYGFIIVVSSDLIYFSYEISGHLLKITGFYFINLALYKSSVELPYEKLAIAEEKLRHAAEEKYRNLFDNAYDAIIIHDLEGKITSWNRAAEKIFGWTGQEIAGKNLSSFIVPRRMQAEIDQIIGNVMLGGSVTGIEKELLRKDGGSIAASVTISPLLDEKQNIIGTSCIIRDITERKKAEEQIKASLKEKELLLQEVHHRVKNNLQVISSLLNLQSEYIREEKSRDMFKESQNRLMSMSLIHEKLYKSKDFTKLDFNEYVRELVDDLFQSYEGYAGKITLNINIDTVSLDIDSAIPCGLIISELVTNSLKYAFPDGRKGELNISLRPANENMIELMVGDNGVGIPEDVDFKKTATLGLHIVTMLVEGQLHGEISLNRAKGTEFKIKFRGRP